METERTPLQTILAELQPSPLEELRIRRELDALPELTCSSTFVRGIRRSHGDLLWSIDDFKPLLTEMRGGRKALWSSGSIYLEDPLAGDPASCIYHRTIHAKLRQLHPKFDYPAFFDDFLFAGTYDAASPELLRENRIKWERSLEVVDSHIVSYELQQVLIDVGDHLYTHLRRPSDPSGEEVDTLRLDWRKLAGRTRPSLSIATRVEAALDLIAHEIRC